MTDAKTYAGYCAIALALGTVVGVVGWFVSDPGHAAVGAGTVTLDLRCVNDHLGGPMGKLEMLTQCGVTNIPGDVLAQSFMPPISPQYSGVHRRPVPPISPQHFGAHRSPAPVAKMKKKGRFHKTMEWKKWFGKKSTKTAKPTKTTDNIQSQDEKVSTDIPEAAQKKDTLEIRSLVADGLGPNKHEFTLARHFESNPMFDQAVELTRRVLEPQRPNSGNAFSNVPASMEKAVVALTNKIFSPELKQTIQALNKYAAKLGDFGRGSAAELSKMDVSDFKRHLFAGTVAVAASLSPSVASAGENVANVATTVDYGQFASYLAVVLGLSIPCVFLITLFIQSDAQGTATTFRQPERAGGKRFEDE